MSSPANSINEATTGITGFTGTAFVGSPATQHTVQIGGATTSTLVSVANGTTGQFLGANTGAAPTWQTPGGGSLYVLPFKGAPGSLADSTTYYLNNFSNGGSLSQNSATRTYIPVDGTITKAVGSCVVGGTLASSENSTLTIRLNDTSNTDITTTAQFSSANNPFSNLSLGIAVSAGDYIEVLLVTPGWVTNPTTAGVTFTLVVE